MANTPSYLPSLSGSNTCKCVEKVVDGRTSLPSSSFYLNGNKRKRSFIDGLLDMQDGSPLSLGLGCSMSSGVTVFSCKENEEHNSCDLDLSMNLMSETNSKGPEVDLELSLAAGSVESDVTANSRASFPFKYNLNPPVSSSIMTSAGIQLVDEGSTSSRWKLPLFSPFQTAEPMPRVHNVSGYSGLDSVIHGGSASYDSGLVPSQQRRNSNVKECRFIGCTRGARGASGFCIAHGGGRRCQREGCQKGAEGKTVFCKAHGGGRRCEFLGCTKSAEGRTDFCIGHGGGRRCSHDGCTHAARGKSGLCIRHGGGKRCKMEGCTKSAEGISGLCISHGGGRRCQYPACTKGAQGSTMFCKAHGGGKRCTFLGCTKGAEGSTSFCKGHGGGKRCTFEGGCSKSVHGGTLFCVSHGGGKRCAVAECTKSARGRTSFCVRHGGGKRCKHEGCGKSAQGRTDFCKAHGGGKRCSWIPSEPSVGHTFTACDKFARGKTGLCGFHNQLAQHNQIPGVLADNRSPIGYSGGLVPAGLADDHGTPVEVTGHGGYSLPEGRVHGGGLMAMLRGSPIAHQNQGKVGPWDLTGAQWV
uniref:loricrin-like n=1 Tax=Erigeron canadensis TaxID=72917 RepID=UPI001CB922CF|nr:loricrin-like [Erigeron canadensis]